jgi:hypothetical protein
VDCVNARDIWHQICTIFGTERYCASRNKFVILEHINK